MGDGAFAGKKVLVTGAAGVFGNWITGRAQRIALLERLIEHIQQFQDVWWTTADGIVDYHRTSVNFGTHSMSSP